MKDLNSSNSNDILTNGNFETGNLTGWSLNNNGGNCNGIIQKKSSRSKPDPPSSFQSGSYYYQASCDKSFTELSQKINITQGHVYLISFLLFNEHDQNKGFVEIV